MAEQAKLIRYVTDFSRRPGPRYCEQGPSSGEEFYDDFLNPWFKEALNSSMVLEVVLDGTDGYLTSFIDEAFGRLVYDFGIDCVKSQLSVVSQVEPEWNKRLENKTFPAWVKRKEENQEPKHTEKKS